MPLKHSYFVLLSLFLVGCLTPLQSQTLSGKNLEEEEKVQFYWDKALAFADSTTMQYEPDSAYVYLEASNEAFRKLSSRDKRKLEKAGISKKSIRRFRSELKEMALAVALSKNSLAAIEQYLERYPGIIYRLEEQAKKAYYRLKLEALEKEGDFEWFQTFYQEEEQNLKQYTPELLPVFAEKAHDLYFANRDTTDLFNLLGLLQAFPQGAVRLDAALANAVERQPFIWLVEKALAKINKKYLPKTVWAIYESYRFEGKVGDLLEFGNNYPAFSEDARYRYDLAIVRKGAPLWQGVSADNLTLLNEYIREAAPHYDAFFFLQVLVKPFIDAGDWAGAIAQVEAYAPAFGESHPLIDNLLALLRSPDAARTPIDLGFGINTTAGEYAPVISADEQSIYFCRKTQGDEDIYLSKKELGLWGKAVPLTDINRPRSYEAPLAISADGNTLLVFKNGEVRISYKKADGWSAPQRLFPDSKKMYWQGGTSISADGKVIVFAARRADCVGLLRRNNIDLFITFKQPDGTWQTPLNMGLIINTPLEERSPFLHPDMRTLYFSTDGRGGLGGMDVFKTTRVGDSWTEWTTPVNLGKAINTTGRDWGYRISTEGSTAYFAAEVPNFDENLFQVTLPEALRPNKVATILGTVSGLSGDALLADILIEDLETGETVSVIKPDPETGRFTITLPVGRRYSYVVKGEGLFPKSNNLDLRTDPDKLLYTEDISVPTIDEMVEDQVAMPLKNLFFETDAFALQPASFPELNRIARILQTLQVNLEISGHTDNVGKPDYNKRLSEQRAASVRAYLIEQGCASDRIQAVGKGMEEPVASNADEAGRALNRRVEIRFVEIE
jgi:outer membrane protein OmpA-like peptidoglycan-associated protein